MTDLQKEWNKMSRLLEDAGAGPLPGATNQQPTKPPALWEKVADVLEFPELHENIKEAIKAVLVEMLNTPKHEICGKELDWMKNIGNFAWKHKIGL